MTLQMTATEVSELSPGIWALKLPPHQVRHFGNTNQSIGTKSVLLFNACSFDAETGQLHFNLEDVSPINVGTTAQAIGILASGSSEPTAQNSEDAPESSYEVGPGDREFLEMAKRNLSTQSALAAEQLLRGVRTSYSGNLKRGKMRNFSETPDNFWYVIIQPRVDELQITVRGPVTRFQGMTSLEVKDDRGNTRFKVRGEADVPEALKLISNAIRKA
ncbi:hypothetical protein BD830_11126 [Maritimibacter alkaliphilus HTCC2654]|uniref:Uncharacterized protein n=1 Tax=Maritimibacter alkaliphilus HTCC2654 TaxID=314271 RepID=A3VF72_9RHOB|nr:hypothetical protein [Maritimibacter alkaliphilus]EAQ12987.1 hypothetical protein RB2654_10833 [Rhodobacterales bacterium HTCC2654] [Maritimibacter alkaliphilus HTCC2654]TYP79922.1 hypothetical protein BD830_11126 [Maritimibacter alkaliphilus HTCC2654]